MLQVEIFNKNGYNLSTTDDLFISTIIRLFIFKIFIIHHWGFGVLGAGFRDQGLGLRVEGLGLRR